MNVVNVAIGVLAFFSLLNLFSIRENRRNVDELRNYVGGLVTSGVLADIANSIIKEDEGEEDEDPW